MLTAEQVQFFRDNGFLKISQALAREEVQALRNASQALIDRGPTSDMTPGEKKDYQYGRVKGSDSKVLRRIEYVLGKGEPFLLLLGHPVLLDAVQKIVGEQFVPTFDSMVIKMPGNGVEVPWHRDGGGHLFYDDPETGHRFPAVNFDFYLDEANETNGALWVMPGSNKDEENRTPQLVAGGEYSAVPGAIVVDMQPGDMLLHDTMLYHGSPETRGNTPLRRVIYYEFRDLRFINALHRPLHPGEIAYNKWSDEWLTARLAILQQALDKRQASGLEIPFSEHPYAPLRVLGEQARAAKTRVPHPGWDASAAAA